MSKFETKKLADSQLEAFDAHFIDEERMARIRTHVDRDFPTGEFTFLDIGGGNGSFADQLLETYPAARGTVVDNAEVLVARNQAHPRKQVVESSIEQLTENLDGSFDVVFLNFVLHHLIGTSFADTRNNQRDGVRVAASFLAPEGRVSVYENIIEGPVFARLPGWTVFQLTASRTLAPLVARLGANTAGTGVCYLSAQQWRETLAAGGLEVRAYRPDQDLGMSPARRRLLHVRENRRGYFWCARA